MKKVFLAFSVMAFQFFWSQETRNVGDFSSVKVYDKISVVLLHSKKNKVEIDGNNNGDIEIVNKNGELKIRMTPTKIMQGDHVKVKIFYESLNDIQASQGSEITSEEAIEGTQLSLTSNEGSKIDCEIDVERLNVKANSGGELKISGKADNQDILVNSGARFFGKEIDSKIATIAANAGGIAEVTATNSVNATTRAGGNIVVYGNPEDKQTKKILGGNISFR